MMKIQLLRLGSAGGALLASAPHQTLAQTLPTPTHTTVTTAADGTLRTPAPFWTANAAAIADAAAGAFGDGAIVIGKISGLQPALDLKAPLAGPTFTGTVVLPSTTSIGGTTPSTFGRSIWDDADAAAGRATLGVVIGTDVAAASLSGATTQAVLKGSSAVEITGEAFIGQALTATNAGTAPVAWFVNGVAVAGESGDTYRVRPGDAGKSITATNAAGHASDPVQVWSPTEVEGCRYVFIPDQESSYASTVANVPVSAGTGVAALLDQVTKDDRATNSTVANQPSFVARTPDAPSALRFNGSSQFLAVNSAADSGVFRASAYGAIFVLARSALDAAATADATFTTRPLVVAQFGSGSTRLAVATRFNSSNQFASFGRQLDADSVVSAVAPYIAGYQVLTAEADWAGGKMRLFQDGSKVSETNYAGTANTSDTALTAFRIGSDGTTYFAGDIAGVVVVDRDTALPVADRRKIERFLGALAGIDTCQTVTPFWGSHPKSPSWTAMPGGVTTTTVITPSGGTPTELDGPSHRFRLQSTIHVHPTTGTLYGTWCSSGTNEEGPGQQVWGAYSLDDGATWSAPTIIVPAQSNWDATGASLTTGTRIAVHRAWVTLGDRIFYVASIVRANRGNLNLDTAEALVAVEALDDDTWGTPFRVTPDTYAPMDGKTEITYDAVLGPQLYPHARDYGVFGGSGPLQPQKDWSSWDVVGGRYFFERAPFSRDGSADAVARLHRNFAVDINAAATADDRAWFSTSDDGFVSSTRPFRTDIPITPALIFALRLSDGRIALIGNPAGTRIHLYLAIMDAATMAVEAVYTIRENVSTAVVYPGTAKSAGCHYPYAIQVGSEIWVVYAERKEAIVISKFAVPAP